MAVEDECALVDADELDGLSGEGTADLPVPSLEAEPAVEVETGDLGTLGTAMATGWDRSALHLAARHWRGSACPAPRMGGGGCTPDGSRPAGAGEHQWKPPFFPDTAPDVVKKSRTSLNQCRGESMPQT